FFLNAEALSFRITGNAEGGGGTMQEKVTDSPNANDAFAEASDDEAPF
ncbi:MAG: hypothetical protein HKN47_08205, partial [Pirellulaceae bacterium]|nr:hypothetical protein [Pirellulaceae bacterium]